VVWVKCTRALHRVLFLPDLARTRESLEMCPCMPGSVLLPGDVKCALPVWHTALHGLSLVCPLGSFKPCPVYSEGTVTKGNVDRTHGHHTHGGFPCCVWESS